MRHLIVRLKPYNPELGGFECRELALGNAKIEHLLAGGKRLGAQEFEIWRESGLIRLLGAAPAPDALVAIISFPSRSILKSSAFWGLVIGVVGLILTAAGLIITYSDLIIGP